MRTVCGCSEFQRDGAGSRKARLEKSVLMKKKQLTAEVDESVWTAK